MSTYTSSVSDSKDSKVSAAAVAEDLKNSLAIAKFSLDIVLCIGALGSLIWLSLLRRRNRYDLKALPMWTVLGSVVSVFLYEIFGLPSEGQSILKTSNSSKAYRDFYYPGSIIGAFFRHATMCALFAIFYKVIHVCLEFSSGRSKPPRWIKVFHWVIIGVIVITAIIDWAFFIQQMLAQKARSTGHSTGSIVGVANRLFDIELAISIIRWLPSMEILAWTIYLSTKTFKTRSKIRTPSIFLLFGSVSFFALNMMWAIYYINFFATNNVAATAISGVGLTQTIFIFLIYLAMLPFCVRWGLVYWDDQGKDLERIAQQSEVPLPLAEMDVSRKPFFIAEADSRILLEAGEAKPIVEADGSKPVVEADSRMVGKDERGNPPQYETLSQSERSAGP